MSIRAHRRALLLATGLLLVGAVPAAAQGHSVTVDGGGDSTWIVERVPLATASRSLATRDRQVALVLLDTTLVLQFTDAGLERVHRATTDSVPTGLGGRILAQMFGAALGTLFDHGIATPLSSLREARVEGTRLVLEARDGHRVFQKVQVDGRDEMNEFTPAEAARFAAQINRAIGR